MHSKTLYLCSELVSVALLSGRRAVRALDANLEQISESNAVILTQDAVAPGTQVRVKGKTHELKGFVRSCNFDNVLGFFVDIDLDTESRWSEKWFLPEHIFALCPTMRYFTEKPSKVPEKNFPARIAHAS